MSDDEHTLQPQQLTALDRRVSEEPGEVWTFHTTSRLRFTQNPQDALWVITLPDGRLGVESNMTPLATRAALRRLAEELPDDAAVIHSVDGPRSI